MNKEQLQQKLANMEAELALMKELLNKPEPTINYWQPKTNEDYYCVTMYGDIDCITYNNYVTNRPIRYRVFKTEAEAQKYADYIKAEETLRRVIAEANEGWLPNWSNRNEDKYSIYFKANEGTLYLNCGKTVKHQSNFMYIKSRKDAEQIIVDYEQELITYLTY